MGKYVVLLLIALASVCHGRRRGDRTASNFGGWAEKKEEVEKTQKHVVRYAGFPPTGAVHFEEHACEATVGLSRSGNPRVGTCLPSTDCNDRSGSAHGGCAAGFGVCCLFIVKPSTTTEVSENNTYLQNSAYPGIDLDPITHTFVVNRCSQDVCFLRLDFESFQLTSPHSSADTNAQPSTEGVCVDKFVVTTLTGQSVPVICGENAGQHLYVDIGSKESDKAFIKFALSKSAPRTWDIRVTQLKCGSPNVPPSTCLQYFTGITGRITTFNFNGDDSSSHLANQEYSICVRNNPGYCCVEYSVCRDCSSDGFTLDTSETFSVSDNGCVGRDHVSIPQSYATCNPTGAATALTRSRYCGTVLNFQRHVHGTQGHSPVCDCTPPFTVDIYTDGQQDGIAPSNNGRSRGVCLEYRQIPC